MTNSPLTHYEPESENYTQHIAVGVGILSFFIAAAVSPFVGVGVALYCVHRYLDKDKLAADKDAKERQLEQGRQQYFEQVLQSPNGEFQIPRGLSWRDGSLAEFIERMEAHERQTREQSLPSQQPSPKDLMIQQLKDHANQANTKQIGQNTHLNAIEVPAATVPPKPQQFAVTTAWDTVLGDPMRSRAIFGGQRTGKSYFAAAATRKIKQKQNTRIFHINLHSFGNEDSYYWQHAEQSIAVDMSIMDFQQAKVVVQSALRLVEAFYKTPNAILVFDEITIVGATNSRYRALVEPLMMFIADKITILCSSGKKRQQAIWALAPEMVAANLTQPTKAIKTLSLLYISIAPGRTVKWEGQTIGASLELWNQLNVNYPIAPMPLAGEFECDRIACIDTEWIPLGDVPKLEPDSHKLERLVTVDAEDVPDEEELTSGKVEKPDMEDKEIYKMAIELEEWINAHSEVERSKWWANWNARRRGLSRAQFRYLLTLIEE
jgi:hypothetical protein